jgi:hypothetical protein
MLVVAGKNDALRPGYHSTPVGCHDHAAAAIADRAAAIQSPVHQPTDEITAPALDARADVDTLPEPVG